LRIFDEPHSSWAHNTSAARQKKGEGIPGEGRTIKIEKEKIWETISHINIVPATQ
jgi:hypothetical protein